MVKPEQDIEEPAKSLPVSEVPQVRHHALHFVCDTLRMYVSGGVSALELDR
jgi:chemotaxis protein MotA